MTDGICTLLDTNRLDLFVLVRTLHSREYACGAVLQFQGTNRIRDSCIFLGCAKFSARGPSSSDTGA